jgi:hypothetical protein
MEGHMADEKEEEEVQADKLGELLNNIISPETGSKSQDNDAASLSMRNTVKKGRIHQKNRYRFDFDQETLSMARLISALHTIEETGAKDDEKLLFVVKLAIKSYFNGPFQDELKKLSERG